MSDKTFHFFALAARGNGISGGDRIFIELARRWSLKMNVNVYLWEEGYEMCQRQSLNESGISYHLSKLRKYARLGFIFSYLAGIIEGIRLGLFLKLNNKDTIYIYSASEFWMDSLPCFLLKLRYPCLKWVAAWYQTAPNPLKGYLEQTRLHRYATSPHRLRQSAVWREHCGQGTKKNRQRTNRYYISAFLYWLSQLPIKFLIKRYADFVLVNNDSEKIQYPSHSARGKTIVVLGAVDLDKVGVWQKKIGKIEKAYDAVFQGRFHPQKGVVELIDIWRKVVDRIPKARLAMIGDGPLMEEVKKQITKNELTNNIILLGYLFDGLEKYRVFAQSRLVVHPAYFDSGGMASAEAMAFGLPCIGFDLKAYKSYYPKGMLKVKLGDLDAFAKTVTELLKNNNKRDILAKEALSMINKSWSWDRRASELLTAIIC